MSRREARLLIAGWYLRRTGREALTGTALVVDQPEPGDQVASHALARAGTWSKPTIR